MKVLAFGDIHDYIENIHKIRQISKASYIIITGDLTNIGGKERAKKVIDHIRTYNLCVYALAGNFDKKEVEEYLLKEGISLHGNGFTLDDIGIFGVGGSNITPFNTPNEFEENEIKDIIFTGYKKIITTPFKLFVSHAPPFNTKVDVIQNGSHVGSKAVREFIEKYQPDLCVTGHIHESKGKDNIGRTFIINPGPSKSGGYVEIIKDKGNLVANLKNIPKNP